MIGATAYSTIASIATTNPATITAATSALTVTAAATLQKACLTVGEVDHVGSPSPC